MIKFNKDEYVKNLPDCYCKESDCVNDRLLIIDKLSLDRLIKDIEDIQLSLDLDKAAGSTLDLYGEMIGQPRGVATDDQYRIMIRAAIMRNLCAGDYESVANAIRMTFGCSPSDLYISETSQPATIKVEALPLSVILNSGFTINQTMKIIKKLIPTGIKIESYLFEGTFELCSAEAEMKADGNTKGLTDVEANIQNDFAIGGTLGIIRGGKNIEDLPI